MSEIELQSRVAETERQISELTANVTQLSDSVTRMHADFQSGFKGIYSKFDAINERALMGSRPNYALLIAVIGAIGAFILLHTQPIKERVEKHDEFIDARMLQLIQDYEQFGQNTAKVRNLESDVYDLHQNMDQSISDRADLERHINDLEVWLNAVDQGGSRKWIGSKTED